MSTIISLLVSIIVSFIMEIPAEETHKVVTEENCTIQLQQKTPEKCTEE